MIMQNYIDENNYEILNSKCIKYFNYYKNKLNKNINPAESEMARMGFYFLILERITSVEKPSVICDMIIDTSFRRQWFNESTREMGIDAVNIDEENKIIQLFSFKYRENFKNSGNKERDVLPGVRFFMELYNGVKGRGKISKNEDILEDTLNSITSNLRSGNFNMVWYTITNENVIVFDPRSDFINFLDSIETMFNTKTELYNLKRISDLIISNNKPININTVIKSESKINFSEYANSMLHSLVLKIRLDDLVRISSNNSRLRLNCDDLEDDEYFQSIEPDYNILSDKVRGYIVKSEINKNIIKTLETEWSKFFIYNNGLTLIVSSIKEKPVAFGEKFKLEFENIQVINGGQTLRSIYEFKRNNKDALSILSKS